MNENDCKRVWLGESTLFIIIYILFISLLIDTYSSLEINNEMFILRPINICKTDIYRIIFLSLGKTKILQLFDSSNNIQGHR